MRINPITRVAIFLLLTVPMLLIIVTPAQSSTTGIISGTVTDSASGQKLAGVNIIVEGTNLTTVTDKNGYYVVTNVPPGDHRITASLVGYSDGDVSAPIAMDVTSKIDFSMEQAVAEETSIVVKESRPAPKIVSQTTPTMYMVDNKNESMIKSQPTMQNQAPGILETQPGVVLESDGTPHIRGGRGNEIGWTIDGIPVFDPVSNGFGTNLVTIGMDKMEIFTGGYRPEYGNAISGVMNEVIKTGKTAPGLSLQAIGGGQSFQGLYPEIGGTFQNGGDYYVGSYVWRSDLQDQLANRVNSADTVGKFTLPLGRKDTITFLGMQGSEKYDLSSTHTQTYADGALLAVAPTADQERQGYTLAALTYSHNINSSSFFTVRPYFFSNRMTWDAIGVYDGGGQYSNSQSDTTGFQTDYTNQSSAKNLIKAGFIQMASKNRYTVIIPYLKDYYNNYVGPALGMSMNLGDYAYNANTDSVQSGAYVQDQYAISDRWALEMGLRYDHMLYKKTENPNTSDSQVSPRAGISCLLNPTNRLKFSWGRMIQFPYTQIVERDYVDPTWGTVRGFSNADLKSERSTQYDLGWQRQLGKDYSLQITPFYRKYDNLTQTQILDPNDPLGVSVFENLGKGTSRGVEMLLQKQLSRSWSGWLSYTYMKAKAESSSDRLTVTPGVSSYVDWDQRHTVSMVLNCVKKSWTYSLKGEYGSGLPYGDNNSLRIPSHTVFDLNISKEVKAGSLFPEGTMNLTIANLFNVHNVLAGSMVDEYDNEGNVTGQHFESSAHILPRFITLGYSRHY